MNEVYTLSGDLSGVGRIRLFAVFCLVVALVSIYVGYREILPFTLNPSEPAIQFVDLTARPLEAGLSTYSKNTLLDDCVKTSVSLYGRVQPVKRRAKLLQRCSEAAMQFTAESPTYAYAWFVAAYAAAETGNIKAFNQRLRLSQASGPSELWLCELRVPLAEQYGTWLSEDVRLNNGSDIRIHLLSERGAEKLAVLIFRNADLKERVIRIAEKMPEMVQWRLVQKFDSLVKSKRSI
jgi:hypothetical protein